VNNNEEKLLNTNVVEANPEAIKKTEQLRVYLSAFKKMICQGSKRVILVGNKQDESPSRKANK
jgi:hypothetical protein